eukprot:TRINITY_DN11833_c0_g2_i3.p1 TRINITY_DN11833_c0_g2~~TRINITY_DN11833_c0_g2_i3.p1  ORF type:complete len:373 (+),score=104.74 TRINITY_DN11833_c0_g2_i3:55-1173(+)
MVPAVVKASALLVTAGILPAASAADVERRSASEVVKVPGWPDLSGKFPLSFGIKANGVVYASGMQGMDMKSMKVVDGGVEAETAQTLENLKALLEAAGSSLENVVRCSVSLVDMADFKAMNAAYAKFWPEAPPARVAVAVPRLAGNASVEIQCDAALQTGNREVVKVPGFPDLAKKGFPLSFATKADGTVYLSGAQGIDFSTGKLVSQDVGEQTTLALRNLKAVMEAAGSDADHVTECTVFLQDMADFANMNEAYKRFWTSPSVSKTGALPSRVCTQVRELAGGAKMEVQCTAVDAKLERKIVKVPGWPDIPGFPFSAGATANNVAYISGNQGLDMKATPKPRLVDGGAGPQTTQTLKNIKEALELLSLCLL